MFIRGMPARRWRAALSRLAIATTALVAVGCAVQYEERVSPAVPEASDTLSTRQREAIVFALDGAIRREFAHWAGVPGLEYPALVSDYWRVAMATSDRKLFDLETMAFLANLRNAHTDFRDDWLWQHDGLPLGFTLVWAEGKWAVSESQLPALAAGDVIDAIDGEPFDDFFARQRRYISASSDRGARLLLSSRPYLFPSRFILTLAGGREVWVRRGEAPSPPYGAAPATLVSHRWLVPDSVAYLRIECFNLPDYEREALARLRGEYRRAEGVVIDVRGNCGGASPRALVSALADRPYPWWSQYDAINQGILPLPWQRNHDELDDHGRPRAQPPGRSHRMKARHELRQRLVLLVDDGCASACEDFVMPLQWIGRATVVGDTTFGSSGQPRLLQFGAGMQARVSTRREYFPDGAEFEGVGIAPDVIVPRTVASLREQGDPALDVAIAILRESPARQAAHSTPRDGRKAGPVVDEHRH